MKRTLILLISLIFGTQFNVFYAQNSPSSIPGLFIWLAADNGVQTSGNEVTSWSNLTGSGNNFSSVNTSLRPKFVSTSNLNGLPYVNFDGTDNLQTANNLTLGNSTIFIVAKQNSGESDFSRIMDHGYNTGFWIGRTGNTVGGGFIETGAPFGNFQSVANSQPFILSYTRNNGTTNYHLNKVPFTTPSRTTGPQQTNTNKIFLGSTITGDNFGKKDIFEVIIYNLALSSQDRIAIETYLLNKYSSNITLGQDINPSNFCPVTLTAPAGFTNLLWSTGSTANAISVNQTGPYWLQGTNIFGVISRDTVLLNYPVIGAPATSTICLNNTVQWNTGLGPGFTYLWNTGATTPILSISAPGSYSVQVMDALGCSKNSGATTFTIDNYSQNVFLGADTSLCADNLIALQIGAQETISYEWNGNSSAGQASFWSVDTSGTYSVETMNANGCIAQDTIQITITGQAPLADFSFQNQCFGLSNAFGDLSVGLPNDPVTDWLWDFGDGATETNPSPNHTYNSTGIYTVELYAESAGGCGAFHTEVLEVHDLPNAAFTHLGNCEGQLVNFTNTSVAGDAPISTYVWNFDQQGTNSSTLANPSCLFMNAGNFDVSMEVSDTNGCTDTVSISINIQASPSASFIVNNACEGANVVIQNNSTIVNPFSLVNHYWVYGDGTFANNPSIAKQYNSYGNYTILLVETGSNGCSDSIQQNVTIYPKPQLSWTIGPACQYTYTEFTNNSTVAVGNITNTDWVVNLQFPFSSSSASYLFLTTGIQYLNLTATSDQGCMEDTLILINVAGPLQADFTIDPIELVAGISSNFINNSIGGNSFLWNLGDGVSSSEENVIHSYSNTEIGNTLSVSLQVSNNLGCMDTLVQNYTIVAPNFDLAISNIYCQENSSYWTIACEMKNEGNIIITEANLVLTLLNGLPIMEAWQGSLSPGESTIYIFQSHPSAYIATQDNYISYVCVEGEGFNALNLLDEELANNTSCKNVENDGVILLPLYPNPGNNFLEVKVFVPQAQEFELGLYDIQGRIIYKYLENEVITDAVKLINIPTQELSSGSYLLRLSDETGTQIRKWIKE
jgi:PKD repeat protein